ncbi:MAG: methylenetetrahydrofolate reductase [Pseudomonadota bacterium]
MTEQTKITASGIQVLGVDASVRSLRAAGQGPLKKGSFSYEYFPAKTEKGLKRLVETASSLSVQGPGFQSVTFGTSDDDQSAVFLTARTIEALGATDVPTLSHLALAHETRRDIVAYIDALAWNGARSFLALRGDGDIKSPDESFASVVDLVETIDQRHGDQLSGGIGVACYPETHPLAASPEADLEALLDKQQAGATYAIGQFCFDAETWFGFVSRARAFGITMDLYPGIMPIHDLERLKTFAERCGSSVPEFVVDAFECATWQNPYDVAAGLLREQVTALAEGGVDHIHIYTLNKAELAGIAAETFKEAVERRENSGRQVA